MSGASAEEQSRRWATASCDSSGSRRLNSRQGELIPDITGRSELLPTRGAPTLANHCATRAAHPGQVFLYSTLQIPTASVLAQEGHQRCRVQVVGQLAAAGRFSSVFLALHRHRVA